MKLFVLNQLEVMSELVDIWLKLLPLFSKLITKQPASDGDRPAAHGAPLTREVPDTTQSLPTVSYHEFIVGSC